MRDHDILAGQRYALLDANGRRIGDWRVLNAYPMPSGRLRATLCSLDDPDDTLELYADDLSDPDRFQLVADTTAMDRDQGPASHVAA